jgi:hypothetical protein
MDEEFIKCSICLEDYDKTFRHPRQLPCQHSFCTPCLTEIMTGKTNINCPTCRSNFVGRINDVPKSRFILNFLERYSNNNQNVANSSTVKSPIIQESYSDNFHSNNGSTTSSNK